MSLSQLIAKCTIEDAIKLVKNGVADEALSDTGANDDMLAGVISGIVSMYAVMQEPTLYFEPLTILYAALSRSPSIIGDIKRGCTLGGKEEA